MGRKDSQKSEDLSVTVLYTSQVWLWGKLPNAELFKTPEAPIIFAVVNAALTIMRLFRWTLKSLKHSLLHRHTMIDALVQRSNCHNITELACGLSRRGATLSANDKLCYTEIDLPHVIEKKRTLLKQNPEGMRILEHGWNMFGYGLDMFAYGLNMSEYCPNLLEYGLNMFAYV